MDDTLNAINEAQDVEDDYQYDLNGNMISDQNKHITSITYNHLNLPKKVTFEGSNKSIEYLYDATGVKLRKSVKNLNTANNTIDNAITEYLGGFQYTSNTIINSFGGATTEVTQLQFIPTPEGYVNNTIINNQNHYNYVYNYTDHLGNIRLSYTFDEQSGTVQPIDEHHYYPFGLELINIENTAKMAFKMQASTNVIISGVDETSARPRLVQVVNSGYQYQYNGKEWQDELGLNWYDYGARNYDASLGRWMNMDPASEYSEDYSTYVFCYNDPINYVDEDGEMPGPVGFVIGALSDYIGQVGYNKFYLGLDFKQSLTHDINEWSIAISWVTGLATGGIDSFKNVLTSKVGNKIFKELIDYGVDVMVETMENAMSSRFNGDNYSFWKSLTGGLIEAGIGKIIPFKYIDKFEKKLFKKMNMSADKMKKFKKRIDNDNHRSKSTQKRNNLKYDEAKKNYSNYSNAYKGVKTVYDAYKSGGADALNNELFLINEQPKKNTSIEVGPLSDGKFEE